jgi:4-amino-4-deoxy-L-arabinose transferase-like glycosyltransferase
VILSRPIAIGFASLLLLLVFALVLNGLQEDSLWMDEGYSAWLVRDEMRAPESPRDMLRYVRDSFATSFERLRLDVHPPLYYFLLDAWTLLIGNSEFALRLLSALMGLLALAATYSQGATAFNRRAGLMALLLLGTSGFFIYYSREARSYGLYMALASLSTFAYWCFYKKSNWQRGIAYTLVATGLLYTHYTSITVIAAHGIFSILLLIMRQGTWKQVFPFLLIAALFAPWWFLYGQEQFRLNTSVEAAGALPSDWATLAALWLLLTSGIWGIFALILSFSRLNPLIWLTKNRHTEALFPNTIILLLLAGLLPPIILLLANAYGLAIFQLRYLIAIVPIWAILVAYALSELWIPFVKNPYIKMAVSLIFLLWISYIQLASFREFWPEKPRWREASALASEASQPLEPALVYLDEKSPFAYYAYQDSLLDGMSIRVSWREFAPKEVSEIGENLADAESVWALVAMQAPESWDAVAALSENRGVSYRDSVQWTIYYRFDAASHEALSFNFGEAFAYQSPFYRRYESFIGEEVCVPILLEALHDVAEGYSIGLHLTRGYNEVVKQLDEGLGAVAAGEIIERELCLTIPEAGSFHLRLVIYDWRKPLRRLPVLERDLLWGDYLMVGVVEVEKAVKFGSVK